MPEPGGSSQGLSEEEYKKTKDPIMVYQNYLQHEKVLTDELIKQIDDQLGRLFALILLIEVFSLVGNYY